MQCLRIYTEADTPVFFFGLPRVAFNFKEEDPLLGKDGISEGIFGDARASPRAGQSNSISPGFSSSPFLKSYPSVESTGRVDSLSCHLISRRRIEIECLFISY